jgi:hypothetical protein
MFCIAVSASASVEKRTKPKPLLRPVSRSLTTTYGEVSKSVPLRALRHERYSRPLRLGRTPRTSGAESGHRCATQDLCQLVSGGAVTAVRFDLPYEELRHGDLKEH